MASVFLSQLLLVQQNEQVGHEGFDGACGRDLGLNQVFGFVQETAGKNLRSGRHVPENVFEVSGMGTPGHDAQKAFLYSGEHGTALGRREAVLSRDGKETASCLEKVSYAVLQGRRFRVGLFGIRPGKGEAG